jgi:predicted metal-dependent phosphoesterase TrpH
LEVYGKPWIAADLHIHTKYSNDSFLSPRKIVKIAKKKRLSAIAITDHETVKGAVETIKENSNSHNLLVIPGIEIRTDIGDIIGLFIEEDIVTREIYEAIDCIKEFDGVTILPHPCRGHKNLTEEIIQKIDLVEGLNGRSSSSKNLEAIKFAFSHKKPIIAGSDAHFSFEIGCVKTLFCGAAANMEDLKKIIDSSKRKLVGKESPFFVHIFSFAAEIVKKFLG